MTAVLVSCLGCGVAPGDWHRGRCLVVYGRLWTVAWLLEWLVTWIIT